MYWEYGLQWPLTLTEAFPDQLLFWPHLAIKADGDLNYERGDPWDV